LESARLEVDILTANARLMQALGFEIDEEQVALIERDREEIIEFATEVEEYEVEVAVVMRAHERLAVGVTLLSVAITLGGMALVTRRKFVWYGGLFLSVIGAGYVITGLQTHLLY
jgi:hypothetical protein